MHGQHRATEGRMTDLELHRLLSQARDLGVPIVALVGGEPQTRPEILNIVQSCPHMLFVLITNGAMIDAHFAADLERARNVIPLIGLEGLEEEIDGRRGEGVYRPAMAIMDAMRERGIFFGVSIKITRPNFELITSRQFVRALSRRGCRLFFYFDHVPIQLGTGHLVPSGTQHRLENFSMALLRREFPGVFSSPRRRARWRTGVAGRLGKASSM